MSLAGWFIENSCVNVSRFRS